MVTGTPASGARPSRLDLSVRGGKQPGSVSIRPVASSSEATAKLHNLEGLPGDGFTVRCFPAKIRGASAGWTRAVAILDD